MAERAIKEKIRRRQGGHDFDAKNIKLKKADRET